MTDKLVKLSDVLNVVSSMNLEPPSTRENILSKVIDSLQSIPTQDTDLSSNKYKIAFDVFSEFCSEFNAESRVDIGVLLYWIMEKQE